MNKNYNKRDTIIFGKYDADSYFGGLRRFTCTKETMQQLIDEKFIDPDECQNDSPSTADFMKLAEGLDNVEFGCYAISPEREDYRITIEEVVVEVDDNDFDVISALVENLRWADEFSFEHVDDHYVIDAWWD